LLRLHRGVVLRNIWAYSCNRTMRSRVILGRLGNKLLKVPSREFPINFRLYELRHLYCWLILRHRGPNCNNRRVCCRLILSGLLICLFEMSNGSIRIFIVFGKLLKLSHRGLHGLDRIDFVYGLSRRLELRFHGIDCRDKHLRSGLLLCRLCSNLLDLSSWIVFIFIIFHHLLKLSVRNLWGIDWIVIVYGMPRRLVL